MEFTHDGERPDGGTLAVLRNARFVPISNHRIISYEEIAQMSDTHTLFVAPSLRLDLGDKKTGG